MNGRNVFNGFPARIAIAILVLFGFLPMCRAGGDGRRCE